MLRPQVAHYNSRGVIVSLVNTNEDFIGGECELLLNRNSGNAKAACKKAAARLRKMADALDIIAESDKPFHEETCIAAVRAVKKKEPTVTACPDSRTTAPKELSARLESLARQIRPSGEKQA